MLGMLDRERTIIHSHMILRLMHALMLGEQKCVLLVLLGNSSVKIWVGNTGVKNMEPLTFYADELAPLVSGYLDILGEWWISYVVYPNPSLDKVAVLGY